MNRERKLRAVRKVLGEPRIVKGDEHVFYCPSAEHDGRKKLKLSVNVETDRFNCWSCGFRGPTLERLLRLIPSNPDVDEYLDGAPPRRDEAVERFEDPEIPDGFQTLVSWAREDRGMLPGLYGGYLRRRGITFEDICLYKLGFCHEGKYAGRVVIPSFGTDGRLNTFAARTIYSGIDPKYDAPAVDKSAIVFNELMIDWSRDVVVVEGQMDAIVGGDNVVPICGKVLSARALLFKRLAACAGRVLVALDPDAWEEALDLCDDLAGHGADVRFVPMDGSDPADCGRPKFRERLAGALDVRTRAGSLEARRRRMLLR